MDNKRLTLRHRQLKAAKIIFNGGHSSVSCTVRDWSDSGCRLLLEGTLAVVVPDSFQLRVDIDGTRAECEAVWRERAQMGVRFLAPPEAGRALRNQVVTPIATPGLRLRKH